MDNTQQDPQVVETPKTVMDDANDMMNEHVGISLVAAIVLCFAMSLMSVVLYHFYIAPKPTKFGLLDVQKITSLIENQARQTIVENLNASEAQQQAARNSFEYNMRNLQEVINKTGDECQCVLIVKAATLNTQSKRLPDYTAQAIERMNLQPVAAPVAPVAAPQVAPSAPAVPADRIGVPTN
ncbi:hypothetical protein [Hydromonas duriensis]|uniref:Type F conjugative transfer system protein TrbI n=1 Tax=Hydromonas duriensis TaxID=1527608 RepID=A0A4R6Y4X6_9BURK|nr:hypothetical protein [Hydromonas duriensis]TDR30289.1 hypothetical protein DFR44_12313 [Hydromonas duriensis]